MGLGGDSWRQSCPLNPQPVPEGPTSPTVTSEISPNQHGCTQDSWDLLGVPRSGPLPCPDGPGLPLSIPGEDNGPCCQPAALGHVVQRPSDPEQHCEEVPADSGTCLLTNEGLLVRALTLVSRQKLSIRGPRQGPRGKRIFWPPCPENLLNNPDTTDQRSAGVRNVCVLSLLINEAIITM